MKKLQTKLAIDLGNGFIKGKSNNLELIIPSSIILKKNLSVSAEDLGKNYNLYCINDIEFVAGKALEDPNFVIEAKDLLSSYAKNSNRYKLDTFKLLMLSTITDLLENEFEDESIVEVELVTGLPSNDLLPENINLIKDFLENKTHSVKKNNKEYLFKVVKTVIIEQPLATLLDLAIINNKINTGVLDNNSIVLEDNSYYVHLGNNKIKKIKLDYDSNLINAEEIFGIKYDGLIKLVIRNNMIYDVTSLRQPYPKSHNEPSPYIQIKTRK